jgi:hypothetical protein
VVHMKAADEVSQRSRLTAIALPSSGNVTFSNNIKGREIMTRSSMLFAAIIAVSALMSTGARADDAKCTAAKDCSGALPQICMVCRHGGDGCAHWACVKHACKIAFCNLYGSYK